MVFILSFVRNILNGCQNNDDERGLSWATEIRFKRDHDSGFVWAGLLGD